MSLAEVEIARNMRSKIESYGDQMELECRVPYELIDDLRSQGIFAMMTPEIYGGTQRPPIESLRVIEELAYADSAVGWSAMIYYTTSLLGSFLPEKWAKEIYGTVKDGDVYQTCPIAAGAAAPNGKGEVVDGGIVVSGRWPWGSGTHNCDWIAGGTIVYENGEMQKTEMGGPAIHVVFFKQEEVQLHNNWNPSGLRGTGSVDFEVKNCFVPDGRWTVLGVSRRQVDAPLYRFPFYGYFAAAVASVPLGIARRAIDDFETLVTAPAVKGKAPQPTTPAMTQLEFGRAEALVGTARHAVHGAVTEVWERLLSGDMPTGEDKRQLRLLASQAAIMCADAVERLYNASGGNAIRAENPIQNHFRNIHAAKQHRMVSPEFLRMSAGVRLDGESTAQI